MSPVRTVLPLAAVTATSMLAMDLVLPAVPALQRALGASVPQGQAVVALFLAALALSQLLWGELLNRLGPRRCLLWGVGLLALASAGCAFASSIEQLLAWRALQGAAAGAAPVVATSIVRATLDDRHAVRGMALIAMIESIVPAAGPALGAVLLPWIGSAGLFGVLGVAAAALLPLLLRIAPARLPGLDATQPAGYADILRNRRFVRLALAHALSFGALLTLVASAPQLLVHAMGRDAGDFALLQMIGVAGFASVASQSGRIARWLGPPRAIQAGALVQVLLCAGFFAASLAAVPPFGWLAAFWCAFCGALAVRGPTAFAEALRLPAAQLGRATALMVLALLAAGAIGTQAVAPFLGGASAVPLATAMLLLVLASSALLWPYPRDAVSAAA